MSNILNIKISSELKNIFTINKVLLYNLYVIETVLRTLIVYKDINM